MKKFVSFGLILILAAIATTGCYFQEGVATNQVALQIDGGRVLNCVGPGVYSDIGFFSDLREIPADTQVFEFNDPQVATKDNQLVGVTITVQVRRRSDCDSLKNLATNWSQIAEDNKQLEKVVASQANSGIKVGVHLFTFEALLNDRNGLANSIETDLRSELTKASLDIVNVSVKDVTINNEYAKVLDQKALLSVQVEAEKRKQELIKQQADNARLEQDQKVLISQAQLKAEQAATEVQMEIASRDGRLTEARNRVYQTNPAALELERLRLLKEVLGDKATLYFIPQGTSLNFILSNLAGTVPIQPGKPQ